MCKKCGINNSNCGCGSSSTYNTSTILFDSQDFVCPSYFILSSGESLNDVINTLAVGICTNTDLPPNPGDQGPIGEQGVDGVQGDAGNPNGGLVYEYFSLYPNNGILGVAAPIVIPGGSHIATVDGSFQIHSIVYLHRGPDAEITLSLWIDNITVDTLVIDNLSFNHESIDSFIFNWQANVLVGQVIEVKIEVITVRAIYKGGSLIINQIPI
jgi:hypothetical protein